MGICWRIRGSLSISSTAFADLAATAAPVTDDSMKRRVSGYIVDDFNQPHNPARIPQPTRREDWMEGSPLMEIKFELGGS